MLHTRDIVDGAIAGLVAAVVSSLPGLVHALADGIPLWQPVQQIAAGVGVREPAFDLVAFLLGGSLHLLLSTGLGVVTALAIPRRWAPARTISAAVAIAIGVFLVTFPLFDALGLFDEVRRGAHWWVELGAHVLFGAVVGIVLARRRLTSSYSGY